LQILLPDKIEQQLIATLKEARDREVGGILMGEHIADAVYRIRDLTIQCHGGTLASFVRLVREILYPLKRFFHETGCNFTQFNYLGEWHSHPSFPLEPSGLDCETMWEIVEDPTVGANFAVLLIVRLGAGDQLEESVTVYLPGRQMFRGKLVQEEATP
jgi:hypothetical protein